MSEINITLPIVIPLDDYHEIDTTLRTINMLMKASDQKIDVTIDEVNFSDELGKYVAVVYTDLTKELSAQIRCMTDIMDFHSDNGKEELLEEDELFSYRITKPDEDGLRSIIAVLKCDDMAAWSAIVIDESRDIGYVAMNRTDAELPVLQDAIYEFRSRKQDYVLEKLRTETLSYFAKDSIFQGMLERAKTGQRSSFDF